MSRRNGNWKEKAGQRGWVVAGEQPEIPPPPCSIGGGGFSESPVEECGILWAATPEFPKAWTLHGLQGPAVELD